MGLCAAKEKPADEKVSKEERKKNEEINRGMRHDEVADKSINKLLLLGAGESGKSTLFKQAIKIYGEGFSEVDLKGYTSVIHSNLILCAKTLAQQSTKYGPCQTEAGIEAKKIIDQLIGEGDTSKVNSELVPHIKAFWTDPGIQKTYESRSEYQLPDSCRHFMKRVDAICTSTFVPTEQDVLSVRVRTTGIVTTSFSINDAKFQMFDVGGQRNERKKWVHCFEGVTAVLFVAALSEYDQMLFEDTSVNRMQEALTLFDEICNSKWFLKTSMIIFLNKIDLFKEKNSKETNNVYI